VSGASGFVSIRILLASDHPIVRNNLRSILEREDDFVVVAEAANGREAVVLAEYRKPNVVLLDVRFPDLTGISAARDIASKERSCGVVFVTTETDRVYVSEAFKAGACGYVSADEAQSELAHAIRAATRGERFLSPAIERIS
jgi:DNA-binding NarL/FixJ family response regulator